MLADPAATTALVRSLGEQALPLYAALLLALLAGVAGFWWLGRRYTLPRPDSRVPPGAFLLIRLAAGFAVVLGGAAVFAEVAEALGNGRRAGELDEVFSAAVGQSVGPGALRFFGTLTHLGDTATLTALCIGVAVWLLLQRQRWLALGWTLALAGNALLNTSLKGIFERTRPVHDHAVYYAQGFSFPSGHSSGSVVAYGMLAYVLLRSWPPARSPRLALPLVLAAAALAFTVGCSRIFIRVHYPTDVLAGFASGSAWLAVCVVSIELTRHYRRRPAIPPAAEK